MGELEEKINGEKKTSVILEVSEETKRAFMHEVNPEAREYIRLMRAWAAKSHESLFLHNGYVGCCN